MKSAIFKAFKNFSSDQFLLDFFNLDLSWKLLVFGKPFFRGTVCLVPHSNPDRPKILIVQRHVVISVDLQISYSPKLLASCLRARRQTISCLFKCFRYTKVWFRPIRCNCGSLIAAKCILITFPHFSYSLLPWSETTGISLTTVTWILNCNFVWAPDKADRQQKNRTLNHQDVFGQLFSIKSFVVRIFVPQVFSFFSQFSGRALRLSFFFFSLVNSNLRCMIFFCAYVVLRRQFVLYRVAIKFVGILSLKEKLLLNARR